MHTFDRARDVDGNVVFVVGWIDPHAQWHALRDCKTASEAAWFVSYLNGGERPPIAWGDQ